MLKIKNLKFRKQFMSFSFLLHHGTGSCGNSQTQTGYLVFLKSLIPPLLGSICRYWIGSKKEIIVVKSEHKLDISCHLIKASFTQRDVGPFWYIHYAALPFPSVISHGHCRHQMLHRGQQKWELMFIHRFWEVICILRSRFWFASRLCWGLDTCYSLVASSPNSLSLL